MTRVLVVSPDTTGPMMAGTAIRSVEIARALARDAEVTLAVPAGSETLPGVAFAQVRVPTDSTLAPLVADADCVLVSGRAELMTAIRKPLIVDLYDPFILSDLEFYGGRFNRTGGRPLLALRFLQHHLEHGDLFLCASEVQRSFWLGMLAAAGRVNRANYTAGHGFEELLTVVPFGIPDTPPVHTRPVVKGVLPGIAADDQLVLWAGGLWNWFDPLTLLDALAVVRRTRPTVKALFLGARHPNPDIGAMEMADRARARAQELGLLDVGAFFLDWVPYAERQNYLLEADVGVSLHQAGVEAQFAFRTRVLDYLWCATPMVLSRGDELAARVERDGLGLAVSEGDAAAVADAIVRLLDDPDPAARRARFAEAQHGLAWSQVTAPVRRFCAAPHLAPDKVDGAWFASGTDGGAVPRKEDALITEEVLAPERELSPPLGKHFTLEHVFTAAYDNLCRIDVLTWVSSTPPPVDAVFSLWEDAPEGRRLARVVTPLATLPHNDWQRFEFQPIASARGRRYRLVLAVPGVADAGVAAWLCRTEAGMAPALALNYLVKGVVEELPIGDESFLFLHNTTVSDRLVPGIGALLETGDAVASSLLAAPAADATTTAHMDAGNGTTPPVRAPSPPPAPADDALRAELARVAAALAVAERDLHDLRAVHAAADRRVLPRLARELLQVVRTGLRAGVRASGLLLVALLMVASVPLALAVGLALLLVDLIASLRGTRAADEPARVTAPRDTLPISIVIPTWNGRELLDMSLPPLLTALAAYPPGGEIIVVDNGSVDDTTGHLARTYPSVRVIALDRNEGFAGATNRGIRDSRHPTVLCLNNDMVVEPDFLPPLLAAFAEHPDTFGVSCQIDFIDPTKPRWETGKVHARWKFGTITLFHLDRWQDDGLYPVFFAGGGASAYDRAKLLALGGFDEPVFSPVYIEDVDLGYRAWKRGWPSLFAPGSRVHHKHRGTTRRIWSESTIYGFFIKNLAALVWKNVDDRRLLARHVAGLVLLPGRIFTQAGAKAALATWRGLLRQLPIVMRARLRERGIARRLDDGTIFHVSRYRHAYRGAFGVRARRAAGVKPRVLIVSPYSPYPPIHGGAVRMLALLERLGRAADVTLLTYADTPAELDPRSVAELRRRCREVFVLERDTTASGGILEPQKTRGFWSEDMFLQLEYFLDREDVDVLQVEYTHMAHFLPPRSPGLLRVLVEHDVSFVSLARSRARTGGAGARLAAWFDWMRMLRYETAAVESADLVLTMSDTDRDLLGRFVDVGHAVTIPNGVDCRAFTMTDAGREPDTILFVGFFRHEPNVEAVRWFCHDVLPLVRAEVPSARFKVVGAYPPELLRRLAVDPAIEVTGRVEDIRPYYAEAAVFVAPVLQGSGTRLKIVEAMASGCPVVSTTIGAEGLDAVDGEHVRIADDAPAMAAAIVALLRDPVAAASLAARARGFVEARFDWDAIADRLLASYDRGLDAVAGGSGTP